MRRSAFPIISTPELERALAFYRDGVGGTVTHRFPPDGTPAFVTVAIGDSEVGLAHDPATAASTPSPRFALWVYVDDCDAALAKLREAGVTIAQEPTDQPWGERVARIHDPDGNLVLVGSQARGS